MLDISKLSIQDRMLRAKIMMGKRQPFFSYILFHMNMKETDKVPTMGVDKNGNLFWNKKFAEKLSEEEMIGVLAHETLHIALMHLERGAGKEHQLFNIANDLVVNGVLTQSHFQIPTTGDKAGLIPNYNHEFEINIPGAKYKLSKINEKSSEEIYDELYAIWPKLKKYIGDGDGNGNFGGFDKHEYSKGGNDNESKRKNKAREDKWRKIISSGAQLAKQQGQLPAGMERMIDHILDSKIGWRHMLYKYIISMIPYDYTWSLPSKRTAAMNIYTPRVLKEMVHIAAAIDVSGSIPDSELQAFLSELVSIATSFTNIKINVIICDAEVHETYELTRDNIDDIMSLKMSGGGGTSHIPVYKYVQRELPEVKVLVNFTDGYTDFPQNPQDYAFNSLWVISKQGISPKDVPFGEVIKLDR